MLEVVICDDESLFRSDLKKLLQIELDLCGEEYTITEFDSGEALLSDLNLEQFDLIFLDIEMKLLDGITTAKKLRKVNNLGEIIFVTSYPDFVFQGYEVQALNYILKPYKKEKIREVLHIALKRLDCHREKYYIIEQRNGTLKLPLSSTKYFLSERRSIIACTIQERYTFYGKLNELKESLPEYFVRIHNRYLVNMNYIDSMEGNNVLCEKELLPVSRSLRQDVLLAFAKYMLG